MMKTKHKLGTTKENAKDRELLEALNWILTNLNLAEECIVAYHLIKDNPKKSFTDVIIKRKKLAEKYIFKAIKKATE